MDELQIICGEKEELYILIFCGRIAAKDVSKLEELEEKLKALNHKMVLINFRELSDIQPGAQGAFTKFQQSIRASGKLIGLCSLKPDLRGRLLQLGLIRETEIFNNIAEGWSRLKLRVADKARMDAKAQSQSTAQGQKPAAARPQPVKNQQAAPAEAEGEESVDDTADATDEAA